MLDQDIVEDVSCGIKSFSIKEKKIVYPWILFSKPSLQNFKIWGIMLCILKIKE